MKNVLFSGGRRYPTLRDTLYNRSTETKTSVPKISFILPGIGKRRYEKVRSIKKRNRLCSFYNPVSFPSPLKSSCLFSRRYKRNVPNTNTYIVENRILKVGIAGKFSLTYGYSYGYTIIKGIDPTGVRKGNRYSCLGIPFSGMKNETN